MKIEFNIYAYIILSALLIQLTVDIIANYLNIKSLSQKLPDEFKGFYSSEKYAKSQEYTKAKTSFSMVSGVFDLIILFLFWFLGGFLWLDSLVRSYNYSQEITGILFFAVLLLGRSLFSLPFSIYETFVLEEKFQFNLTTVRTFIMDRVKGIILGILIGGPILYVILWFFINAGDFAWVYVWVAVILFSVFMQYIAPVYIMPLFNKFTPLEDNKLKNLILKYAKSVDFSLTGISVMDGSKRSSKSNAFFTGFGKNKKIALFDTLIEKHTSLELLAVLAHEIGHYKKKHIIKGMIISFIHTGILLFLFSLVLNNKELFAAFGMNELSVYAGLIFFTMLFSPIEMILDPFMNLISRKHEFEADTFAVKTTGKLNEMIKALKKLSVDNLSNLTPHPFFVFLNYSHPPALERIKALRKN
ncbi:MAG: M48 family metallopeptidase [Spirochaetia bacterium]|nr:M48 family metallopeptidase [Spirochaetia bacterium]